MKSISKGFTLIELMIVVAIIGILAAIAIPAYNGYIRTSKQNAVHDNADAAFRFVKNEMTRESADSSLTKGNTVGYVTKALNQGDKKDPVKVTKPAFVGVAPTVEGQVGIVVTPAGGDMLTSGNVWTVYVKPGTSSKSTIATNIGWVQTYNSGVSVTVE